MFSELGKMVGEVVGTIGGMGAAAIAEVLKLPVSAVTQAMKSGCKTYDEIREFCNDKHDYKG